MSTQETAYAGERWGFGGGGGSLTWLESVYVHICPVWIRYVPDLKNEHELGRVQVGTDREEDPLNEVAGNGN